MRYKVIVLIIIISFFPSLTSRAAASACDQYGQFSSVGGFANYEGHEYSNGFLIFHFKFNDQATTHNISPSINLLRVLDCAKVSPYLPMHLGTSYIPLSVNTFSIRFTNFNSPGTYSYRIYDDSNNQPINCSGCNVTFNVQLYFNGGPPHKVQFLFSMNDSLGSTFVSTAQDIQGTSKNPVLIVPGILGTDINKGGDKLWANLGKMATDVGDGFMNDLAFKEDLNPTFLGLSYGNLVGQPFPGEHFYDLIIQEFQNQGYALGTSPDATLFTFPYDWRYGVSGVISGTSTTVDLLKQKIDDILTQTHNSHVDVIAHSTGGLLVKKYVMDHQTDNHIDKVVFVGVPNLGAPKAVKVLLQGDSFGVPFLADSEMQKIAVNLPVTYDLSPSNAYVDKSGSYVKVVTAQGFWSNTKNLTFGQTSSYLIDDHKFNTAALTGAEQLHEGGLDNFDMRTAGVDVYSIAGCKSGTPGKITEFRSQGQAITTVNGYAIDDINGDGTVPLISAQALRLNSGHQFYAIKADHGKMPSADGIRQKIVNLVAGTSLDTGSNIISDSDLVSNPGKCQLSGHWWQIFSPIDIEVIDKTTGNRAGLAADGSVQNNIPGADYEVMGEHKFLFIPTDNNQNYAVNFKGTETGTFTFKDQIISSGQEGQTQIFSNLPVTPALIGQVNLGSGDNQTTLSLQATPESAPVMTTPDSTINAEQSQDLTPPISTSTIVGSMGQPGYYRSDVSITLSAMDPVIDDNPAQTSDVLRTVYALDSNATTTYQGPISIALEGPHTISFFSTDKAGNNEQPQTINFIIDKTAPEAVIQFNPAKKDIQFIGSDNISTSSKVTVLDNVNDILLTDQAGNTTEIKLKEMNRKISMQSTLQFLSYNGTPQDISKNILAFAWTYNKSGNLTFLSQNVAARKTYVILAIFNGKKTSLVGIDKTGIILKSIAGLDLLKVTTNKGDLNWSY